MLTVRNLMIRRIISVSMRSSIKTALTILIQMKVPISVFVAAKFYCMPLYRKKKRTVVLLVKERKERKNCIIIKRKRNKRLQITNYHQEELEKR